jgi:hypothetical protein
MTDKSKRLFKAAPPHNPRVAPAMCMCVECCKVMLAKRCQARDPETGVQCGNYKHRGKSHWMIPATIFQIAEERIRLDS